MLRASGKSHCIIVSGTSAAEIAYSSAGNMRVGAKSITGVISFVMRQGKQSYLLMFIAHGVRSIKHLEVTPVHVHPKRVHVPSGQSKSSAIASCKGTCGN